MSTKTAVDTADAVAFCRCGHRSAMHEKGGRGPCFSKHCPECRTFRNRETR